MLTESESKIISHLRSNARQSGAFLARKLGIPASTFFDKLRSCEQRFVRKHTCLLDFEKLGFSSRMQIVFEVPEENRQAVHEFLFNHESVNSLCKINHGFDFLVECVFRNSSEAKSFIDNLKNEFGIVKFCLFDILEELRKEDFLSCRESLKN